MRFIFVIAVFLFAACSNSKQTQNHVVTESKQDLLTEDSLSMSFERTLCFGACPAFKITILNNGNCLYEGYKFTDRLGKHSAVISKSQFMEILNEAERIGYFTMKDKYDAPVTDVPSVIIMISGPDGRKEIMDRFDAPAELKSFEKFIDAILLNLDWKSLD